MFNDFSERSEAQTKLEMTKKSIKTVSLKRTYWFLPRRNPLAGNKIPGKSEKNRFGLGHKDQRGIAYKSVFLPISY